MRYVYDTSQSFVHVAGEAEQIGMGACLGGNAAGQNEAVGFTRAISP